MRRIVALVAIALAAVFIGVVGVPAVPAHALNCSNSLTCQPANAPLLAEAGMINIGGKGALAPVTQSAGTRTSQVNFDLIVGGLITSAAGMLGINLGLFGQEAGTAPVNPDYVPDSAPDAQCTGTLASQPALTVAPSCSVVPLEYRPNTSAPVEQNGVFVVSGTVSVVGSNAQIVLNVQRTGGALTAVTNSAGVVTSRCVNRSNGAATSIESTSAWTQQPSSTYTRTFVCPTSTHDWQVYAGFATRSTGSQKFAVIGDTAHGFFTAPSSALITGKVRTRVECVPNDGGARYYRQTEKDFAIEVEGDVPIPDAYCKPGDLAISSTVEWLPTGRQSWETLGTSSAPSSVESWASDFPTCYGTAPVVCELTLHRIVTGGALEFCGQYGAYCEGWATGTRQAIQQRYECHFGPYPVDIDYCSSFRAYSTHGVLPNTDKDGALIPVTAPPPTTAPGKTVTPEEVIDAGWGEYIDTTGGGSSECWPTGWGVLNPLAWVYQPLTCAMEWAFVPRTAVLTQQLSTLTTTWQATALGKLQTTLTAWAFVPPAGGCNGITVSVWFLGPPFQVMDACPGSILAPLATWSRFFGNVAFTVYGAIAVTRHIARIVGYEGIGRSSE